MDSKTVSVRIAKPCRTGEKCGRRRLSNRRGSVPPRDKLLDSVSLDGPDDALGDEVGFGDEASQGAAVEPRPVREARCVDQARVDGVDGDVTARELDADRSGKCDLRMLRGTVGTGMPGRDRPRDRRDVDDVRGRSRLERR
jgi:hypothetical protein